MWIVRDGDGRAIDERGDDTDNDDDAELFDTHEEAQRKAERLDRKYDTDGWFHTAWIATTEEDFAEIRRVADILFPRNSA